MNDQGRETLNFQLSVFIYAVVSAVLILLLIGILLLVALAVFQLTFMVVAAVAAADGRRYRYPVTLRPVR